MFKSRRINMKSHRHFHRITATAAAAGVLGLAPAIAEDWPQWGGTNWGRNMYSPEKGLPAKFDPGKFKSGTEEVDLKTTRNVKGVAKIGSQSYSNVTIAGGKVVIGTNNDSARDPAHQGD